MLAAPRCTRQRGLGALAWNRARNAAWNRARNAAWQRECLCCVVLLAACTTATPDATDPEPGGPGIGLQFAALQAGSCTTTSNGAKKLPDDVATLALALRTGEGESIVRVTGSDLAAVRAKGQWLVKLKATDRLDIEVFGCDKTKQVTWYGRSNDHHIDKDKDTPARVFLTPVGKVACTGSQGTAGTLQAGRSLMGGTALLRAEDAGADNKTTLVSPGGDALVVGGIREWSATKAVGAGATATDIYDHRLGGFRKGPDLLVPRIAPHVHVLSDRKVLVAGGLSAAPRLGDTNLPMQMLAPDKPGAGVPDPKAEVLKLFKDAEGGPGSKKAGADVGVGALPWSSARQHGTAITYAGGLQADGTASAKATRLEGLAEVATGGAGKTTAIVLAAGRVRPGLVTFGDGALVVWGGTALETAIGELVVDGETQGKALDLTGADSVGGKLASAAPLVVPLDIGETIMTLLVIGGVPFDDPYNAAKAPTYAVTIDRSKNTAVIKPITLAGGGALRAGLFAAGFQTASRQVLVAGGLLAVTSVPEVCGTGSECVLDGVLLLTPPADLGADKFELGVALHGKLGGPRFGVLALGVPAGVLLAGGQSSLFPPPTPEAADVFETLGQVATPALDGKRVADVCK